VRITIVGLGMTGTSLALALRNAIHSAAVHEDIAITGHDPEPERAARAKRLGAIDRSEWNLPAACEKSGLIVLDLPLEELRRTLETIGGSVAPDAVIVDLAPVKRPVLEFVQQILPHPERFVGGHLLRSPRAPVGGEPSVEQIRGATFYLVALPGTSATALDVATNLAIAVGAEPRHIDAAEHDGLIAATCQLPVVAAAGIMGAMATEAGRQERGGASGCELAALRPVLAEGADPAALLSNSANVLYWIDRYVVELQRLRRLIGDGNGDVLAEALAGAAETVARWTERDSGATPTPPRRGEGGLRDLLLGGLGRGRSSRC
jgi:prephenate dehydrogenase